MPLVPARYLFTRYQIPHNLEQHLIQVASLGRLICQNWTGSPLNQDHILTALLLHDIGNLVKYNLKQNWTKKILTESSARNSHLPQSLTAWQELQTRFQQHYSQNADEANLAIVRELKIDPTIIKILSDHTFDDLEPLLLARNWTKMIFFYCDLRFAPTGIVSVAKRLS
ncbi:MAG TPA: HD domain-containing protein, partial [Candidatus Woesebacteria bacterium]|nr:HD domain-containing protein [Candidatus Woesebacteria bacterium]